MSSRRSIVVGSVIANKPLNGGNAWAVLSWVLGLKKLGFDVYFFEQMEAGKGVDATGKAVEFEDSVNWSYLREVASQFGLEENVVLFSTSEKRTCGLSFSEALEVASQAELLINITGHLTIEPIMQLIRRKAYLDLDPGFTQFWHADGTGGARLDGHDCYFTVGENIGTPRCDIPTCGIKWQPARQPAVLGEWPMMPAQTSAFTTVASWRGAYGAVEHEGKTYGLKVHEFRKCVDLPRRVPARFEIALDIHESDVRDRQMLQEHGWKLRDPRTVTSDPASFRRYVQQSGAEFSAAQGMYVETNSGWFSDRTVRYLASGKPALVQDTGFSSTYPVGAGLFAYRTVEDAVAAACDIVDNYEFHCRAARALAEEHFESNRVLTDFLQRAEIAVAEPRY